MNLYKKAKKLMDEDYLEQALPYYDLVLKAEPNHLEALSDKAVILAKMRKYNESIEIHNKVLSIDPNNVQSLNGKGAYYMNHMKFASMAIKYYKKALEINPKYLKSIINMGIATLELEYYEEALKWFNKAIKIDKTDASVWNNRGCTLHHLNRYDEALRSYQKAVDLRPEKLNSIANIAEAHIKLKEFDDAVDILDRLIALEETSGAWARKAFCYIMLEQYDYAGECADKALSIHPDNQYAQLLKVWVEG